MNWTTNTKSGITGADLFAEKFPKSKQDFYAALAKAREFGFQQGLQRGKEQENARLLATKQFIDQKEQIIRAVAQGFDSLSDALKSINGQL